MSNFTKLTYNLFKKIAFSIDAETAHHFSIKTLKALGPLLNNPPMSSHYNFNSVGLNWNSPIGLAAGLDKNAEAIDYFSHLPFGFIEVGTVTPRPQIGNDRPRLFRLISDESIRNRMGFNNDGADVVLSNLKKSNRRGKLVGVNLGKNKLTENSEAHLDYQNLYRSFSQDADYLVINVSSPNTPGLRDLLKDKGLRTIIESVLIEKKQNSRPLFVKVSPDMSEDELKSIVGLVREYNLEGIIATNTTIRSDLGEGGISGKLLAHKAQLARQIILTELAHYKNEERQLIGVGGFSSFSDLMDYWKSGGSLVQIYTAFIYQGPELLYDIETRLMLEFNKRGVTNFNDFLDSLKVIKG